MLNPKEIEILKKKGVKHLEKKLIGTKRFVIIVSTG